MNELRRLEELKNSGELGKPKILMVDDRPENLVALERLLKNMDVELYRANSGNEALKLTLHHDFALALLDIQMPEMDGYELAELLRSEEKTARMPFIFISAIYTDQIHVFKGYEKGAFSFITKPFEPLVLTCKVDFFIEKFQHEQLLIHAQKLLEQQVKELRETNQELESFSYSVSHDLRAPLRAIEGFSNIMIQKYEPDLDEKGKHYLNVIAENAVRMGQLIDDILGFSRLGRQPLSYSKFSLGDMFEEVFKELTEQGNFQKVKFTLHELPEVEGDRNLIRQVVFNLLSNALKYSSKKESPEIEVGQKETDGRNEYFVKDNGSGFDMKHYDKIFAVFQRLHRHDDFEGNGVGLALAERILKKHNGSIRAESKPEAGATFYFTLNQSENT